jgi:uncharacterized protein YraI
LSRIAATYAQTGDLNAAKTALAALNLANPAQLLISQAEDAAKQNSPRPEVEALAQLANALGARSPILVAYLEPTATEVPPTPLSTEVPAPSEAKPTITMAPTPTVMLPSATEVPEAATQEVTATAASETSVTATKAPAAQATSTASAGKPRVTARDNVNLRAGPGTNYPVIGQLKAGQAINIMGRNQSGDWWRLSYPSEEQAWVAGMLVDVSGPIDTVAAVKNLPTAAAPVAVPVSAPAPTAMPAQPSAPTATPAPSLPAGMQYALKSLRLRSLSEGQQCGGGNHLLTATVLDAGGNPLDGIKVKEVWTGITHTSGEKGPGKMEWVTGKGGGGVLVVVDGAGNPISPQTRGMSDDFPDFDLMKAAGYCSCESLDDAACEAAIVGAQQGQITKRFAQGHYVFEVVFQQAS